MWLDVLYCVVVAAAVYVCYYVDGGMSCSVSSVGAAVVAVGDVVVLVEWCLLLSDFRFW